LTGAFDDWLSELGLGRYATVFAEQRVDFDVLASLTDADLKELGLPLGDRRRLLQAAAVPRQRRPRRSRSRRRVSGGR